MLNDARFIRGVIVLGIVFLTAFGPATSARGYEGSPRQGEPEMARFVSEDGLLTVSYPAGWFIEPSSAEDGCPGVQIVNPVGVASTEETIRPGQIMMMICLLPSEVLTNYMGIVTSAETPPDELAATVTESFFASSITAPSAAKTVDLSAGVRAAYVTAAGVSSDEWMIIAYQHKGIIMITVMVTYAGEITEGTSALGLAVAGSINYAGTADDLLRVMSISEEDSPTDLSGMSYTAAFDTLIDLLRHRYIFTEYKSIDWNQKIAEFRPRFEDAEIHHDPEAFRRGLRDFAWSIPDGHVYSRLSQQDWYDGTTYSPGGLGLAIRELDDGSVRATFILPGGPADQAGIQSRALILTLNGLPVQEAIRATIPPYTFGPEINRRLEQMRYASRFPVGNPVEVTFQNPGDVNPTTATLTAAEEQDSLDFARFYGPLPGENTLPVEFKILDNGYGYIQLHKFSDDPQHTVELWTNAIQAMHDHQVPGVIVDIRGNGGGNGELATQIAGYFFDERLKVGTLLGYDEDSGDFVAGESIELYPPEESMRYGGPVAVLVAPICLSACELFAYEMQRQNRAILVGQYPTHGALGDPIQILMPADEEFWFPTSGIIDSSGQIIVEGTGVAPSVIVPVTEDTLFSAGDPVLDTALQQLEEIHAG
jgi:C-terminal processing protease CtpA/Prc